MLHHLLHILLRSEWFEPDSGLFAGDLTDDLNLARHHGWVGDSETNFANFAPIEFALRNDGFVTFVAAKLPSVGILPAWEQPKRLFHLNSQ